MSTRIKERMITVEWSGRGRMMIDYNGKRYAFGLDPKTIEMPFGAFIIAMSSGSAYAQNLIPVSKSEQDGKLQAENEELKAEIAELKSQIEEMTKAQVVGDSPADDQNEEAEEIKEESGNDREPEPEEKKASVTKGKANAKGKATPKG